MKHEFGKGAVALFKLTSGVKASRDMQVCVLVTPPLDTPRDKEGFESDPVTGLQRQWSPGFLHINR